MFRLTRAERDEVVAICDHLHNIKYSNVLPHAFTEQGVAMLSSVLHSQQAIRVNIEIMRAFVRMRRPLVTRGDLDALEKAICFLLDHPKKAKDMGNQVKILVKKNRDSKILNIKKVDVKSDA